MPHLVSYLTNHNNVVDMNDLNEIEKGRLYEVRIGIAQDDGDITKVLTLQIHVGGINKYVCWGGFVVDSDGCPVRVLYLPSDSAPTLDQLTKVGALDAASYSEEHPRKEGS